MTTFNRLTATFMVSFANDQTSLLFYIDTVFTLTAAA